MNDISSTTVPARQKPDHPLLVRIESHRATVPVLIARNGENAARRFLEFFAATIRNELATLVEVGYLLQPHTSAGRVPSDRGYRYYVDFLMQEEGLPGGVRRQLEPRLAVMPADGPDSLESRLRQFREPPP